MARCRNAVADGFFGIAIRMYVLIDFAVIPVVTLKLSRALQVFWMDSGKHRITASMKPVFLILLAEAFKRVDHSSSVK